LGTRQATTVDVIKHRFPGAEAAIEQAFQASESFRGLCRDYLACAATLARWQDSEAEHGPLRVREYSELLGELTREIEERLRAQER
jgi:hypothetical protein